MKAFALIIPALWLCSCSLLPTLSGDQNYQTAEHGRALELPPELGLGSVKKPKVPVPVPSIAGSCDVCSIAALAKVEGAAVVPRLKHVNLRRNGTQVWLELAASPEHTWRLLQQFSTKNQWTVVVADPLIGLLETSWANSVQRGAQRGTVQRGEKYRYRFRLERTPADRSRVFVRHEVIERNAAKDSAATVNDPELANRLLVDLMVFAGLDRAGAQRIVTN